MPRGHYVRTAETRAKNAVSSLGHAVSAETREKISRALQGRSSPESAERLEKLRHDPEFRQRQREGISESWTSERRKEWSKRLKEEGRTPPSALGLRRGEGFFLQDGYRVLTRQQGHPLAASTGLLHEHRAVLYAKIGSGCHPCYWRCGRILEWGGNDGIHADHVDGNQLNNDPDNLVPSCVSCNRRRGRVGNPSDWRGDLCIHGHELSGDNLYIDRDGHGHCKQCNHDRTRRYRAEKKGSF